MEKEVREAALELLRIPKAVEIRDVDGGEEPFLYSSGNHGPGYVMVKGSVAQRKAMSRLVAALSGKVREQTRGEIDFVAANATGGMIPGWILAGMLELPYVYVRGTRKKGGQKELITGLDQNPEIKPGMRALVVEELVNFANTTCNSAVLLRESGFTADFAACILSYGHEAAKKELAATGVNLIHLLTLSEVLEVAGAERIHSAEAIAGYRGFLKDPLGWQKAHGLEPVVGGGTL